MKPNFKTPSIDWPYKFQAKLKMAKHPLIQSFYSHELPDKNTPLNEVEFLAIDYETTGLNIDKDEIITIGAVPFTLNRIYLNRARHWTVRPRQKLNEDSVIIHGITHSDIMDAPDLSEIMADVLEIMHGKVMVVHYRKIERELLDKALRRRINEGIEFPVIDTMTLEQLIQHRDSGGLWNWIKGKKPQSVRLGQSRQRYSLPPYTPHHALTDAIATAELFQAQIAHHFSEQDPLHNYWL